MMTLSAEIRDTPWKFVDPARQAVDVVLPEPIPCPTCGTPHCLLAVTAAPRGGYVVTCRGCEERPR